MDQKTAAAAKVPPWHWKITHDYLSEQYPEHGNAAGVEGPRGCDVNMPMPYRFRLLDDDGVLCLEGVASRVEFDPLDDYGMPAFGCTEIQFFNPSNNEWEVL
jgi:hypothetical protein